MFVQTAHYFEKHKEQGKQMNLRAYGVEKTSAPVRLAKMNLVLNNVCGTIAHANSYYRDPYESLGSFDYVMTNPPFNVDDVELDGVKDQDYSLNSGLLGVVIEENGLTEEEFKQ